MNIEKLIHTMKNDFGFVFRVIFGMTKITIELNTCKVIGNPKEKVIYFMNVLFNNGFVGKYNEEEEETVFFNDDFSIVVRIAD